MGIPYGVTYTATAKKSEWRPVICEFCSGEFAYRITRQAAAQSTSYLFLDQDGHRAAASEGAEIFAEKALEHAFDPVPCPDCGNYQDYMHRQWRAARAKPFPYVGGGAVPFALLFYAARARTFALALLGVSAAAFFIYWWLMNRTDPNANASARKGKPHPNVLRRQEYEGAIAKALQEGADPNALQILSWKGAKNVARVA